MSGRPKFVLGNKAGSAQAAPVAAQMPPPPQKAAEPIAEPKAVDTPKPVEAPKRAPAPVKQEEAPKTDLDPKFFETPKPAEAAKPAPRPIEVVKSRDSESSGAVYEEPIRPAPIPKPRASVEPAPSTRKEPSVERSSGSTGSSRPKTPGRHDSGASPAVSNPPAASASFSDQKSAQKEAVGPIASQDGSGASAKKDAKGEQPQSKKNWAGFAGMVGFFGAVPAAALYVTGASNAVVGAVLVLQVAIASVYLFVSNKGKGDAASQVKDDGKTGGAAGAAS